MNPLFKLIMCSAFCFYSIVSNSSDILILNSTASNPDLNLDQVWLQSANSAGFIAEIEAASILNDYANIVDYDLIVISSGLDAYPYGITSTLLKYVKNGGSIYIQSEFEIDLSSNKLFSFLVNKTGGSFQWSTSLDGNLNGTSISDKLNLAINNNVVLSNFWYGASGCGGVNTMPIVTYQDHDLGFYHVPSNSEFGIIATISDQDWIRTAANNSDDKSLEVLSQILRSLMEKKRNLPVLPSVRIQFEGDPICHYGNIIIKSQIINANSSPDLIWFKNGNKVLGQSEEVLNIDYKEGDYFQAKLDVDEFCKATVVESNFIEVQEILPLEQMSFKINAQTQLCGTAKSEIKVENPVGLKAAGKFLWYLNESLIATTSEPVYTVNAIADGSKLQVIYELEVECGKQVVSAGNELIFSVTDAKNHQLELVPGKTLVCDDQPMEFSFTGIDSEMASNIQWFYGNAILASDVDNVVIDKPEIGKEIYVTAKMYNACTGGINTISSQVFALIESNLEIEILEQRNDICNTSSGLIELNVEGGAGPYQVQWNDGSMGLVRSGLSGGTYSAKVSDENNCSLQYNINIESNNSELIEDVAIDYECGSLEAEVNLTLNSDLDNIDIKWINDHGELISQGQSSLNLPNGQYQIQANHSSGCKASQSLHIDQVLVDLETETLEYHVGYGESITIGPETLPEGTSIVWQPLERMSCLECLQPEVQPTKTTVYVATVTDDSGCSFKMGATVYVTGLEELLFVPSAFSPNGDGKNDTFKIPKSSKIKEIKSLLVFDRGGSLVHKSEGDAAQERGWDGDVQLQKSKPGVYVYVLDFVSEFGDELSKSGSVNLTR